MGRKVIALRYGKFSTRVPYRNNVLDSPR
jgi:hypothetical protein